jgi:hypothetical protein
MLSPFKSSGNICCMMAMGGNLQSQHPRGSYSILRSLAWALVRLKICRRSGKARSQGPASHQHSGTLILTTTPQISTIYSLTTTLARCSHLPLQPLQELSY